MAWHLLGCFVQNHHKFREIMSDNELFNESESYYMDKLFFNSHNDYFLDKKNNIIERISQYLKNAQEDGGITITGLQRLARSVGVQSAENIYSEEELILNIQMMSGHKPCFQRNSDEYCDCLNCIWKFKCKKLVADWHR